ncbi:hypothetical protein DPMN_124420 [Dreissena polymorpha]|uniref:Uncharacterized protein n=1 Tax=Dreissena polymorpha TaxID=45954 RepID=A0A9D4GS40_DREPO|nr:hypothetical protein DPMN_124420 [Dreissena polymorpha]
MIPVTVNINVRVCIADTYSQSEGTITPALLSDIDFLISSNYWNIMTVWDDWTSGMENLLMLHDNTTPPQQYLLQAIRSDTPEPVTSLIHDTFVRKDSGQVLFSAESSNRNSSMSIGIEESGHLQAAVRVLEDVERWYHSKVKAVCGYIRLEGDRDLQVFADMFSCNKGEEFSEPTFTFCNISSMSTITEDVGYYDNRCCDGNTSRNHPPSVKPPEDTTTVKTSRAVEIARRLLVTLGISAASTCVKAYPYIYIAKRKKSDTLQAERSRGAATTTHRPVLDCGEEEIRYTTGSASPVCGGATEPRTIWMVLTSGTAVIVHHPSSCVRYLHHALIRSSPSVLC